jgi:hypothetical protein
MLALCLLQQAYSAAEQINWDKESVPAMHDFSTALAETNVKQQQQKKF